MTAQPNVSAGLLLFRRREGIEVFLSHAGGPFWARRDAGAWTIPKGVPETGDDDLLATARREFEEETGIRPEEPFFPLGCIRQKAGKLVHAWACEGDADPACITSNTMRIEWPPRSGVWRTYPEVDRCAWFNAADARERINPRQAELIERLEVLLA